MIRLFFVAVVAGLVLSFGTSTLLGTAVSQAQDGLNASLTVERSTVSCYDEVQVTFTLSEKDGELDMVFLGDIPVYFTASEGTMDPEMTYTDSNGVATSWFIAPDYAAGNVTLEASAEEGRLSASTMVTVVRCVGPGFGGVGGVIAAVTTGVENSQKTVAPVEVLPPSTGTGPTIAPPNTGDAGLADAREGVSTGLGAIALAGLVVFVAGLELRRRRLA